MNSAQKIEFNQESTHPEAQQEWWYIHGSFQDGKSNLFDFMLTIFKTKISASYNSTSGYSCIISVLDQRSGINNTVSIIDNNLFQLFLNSNDKTSGSNIDSLFLQTIINQYKKNGPTLPIELSTHKVILENNPFKFEWGSIRLIQEKECILISFEIIQTKSTYSFTLVPQSSGAKIPRIFGTTNQSKGMEYSFYPRLKLTGEVNESSVMGTAWMDHQWGDFSWFLLQGRIKSVLGWDWMGINLENGTDILVMMHKDAESGEILSKYLYYNQPGKKNQILRSFRIIPRSHWDSSKTLITYPVDIDLEIPNLEATIKFTPYINDQEIPFFGPMRAVWQGAGYVQGFIQNKKVKGNARLELNGYGYIFDFKKFLAEQGEKIDKVIEGFFPKQLNEKKIQKFVGAPSWKYEPKAYTTVLSEPVWELMSRKGKRWRPLFARLLLAALEVDPRPYEELLYALTELCHTGSLIIDDIEDNSMIRRGDKAIHLRYGNDIAINAANTLYFLPTTILFTHPKISGDKKREIYELINSGLVKGHMGQGLDIYWSKSMSPENIRKWMNDSIDLKLLQMYAFKTSAGIEGLAETAVLIADGSKEIRNACKEFAKILGVAFQIIDDVHNFNNSKEWRKDCGEDLKAGKLTYLILKSFQEVNKSDRIFLIDLLCSHKKRNDEAMLKKGIKIIQQSGAMIKCREEARQMVLPAWERLSGMLNHSEHKILLQVLSEYLLEHKY